MMPVKILNKIFFNISGSNGYLMILGKILSVFLFLSSGVAIAQTADDGGLAVERLKGMSMEELMKLEVTSVSRRREKLTEVASAIQVITRDDIRRSAATSLPEALRLTTNLQVTQVNSYGWVISARGFNALFSNKLLVMIDGRTVYSPLFAGVSWDAQSVLLEDIDRIEIVSGPGGTLWGANAVNGVINIITKKASETQGLYASGAMGTYLRRKGELRYGGKIGSEASYRLYAKHSKRDHFFRPDGEEDADQWGRTQFGFRMDWEPAITDRLMLQGNFYNAKEETLPSPSTFDGQNVLGRWIHSFSEESVMVLRGYYDRTWRRDIPSTISDELQTYDIDFQHRFKLRKRHRIMWGGGYRLMQNHIINSTEWVGYIPARRNMDLFSAFIQDEITLFPDKFKVIIGTKLQHNVFTDLEIQPNARLAWTPDYHQTVWGAVSRAVRMPSRIDVDYHLPANPLPPDQASVAGGPNFVSEKVIAYELGYRVQPSSQLSLSLTAFYHHYDDLYSVEALPGTQTYQIQNGTIGNSWGSEMTGTWQVLSNWRLRGGYTYFNKDLRNKPGRVYNFSALGNDAKHQALLQSIANLPGNFQFDLAMRYLSQLPEPAVPEYFTFDARIGWAYKQWLEISVAGQNLWREKHIEFLNQIPRSIYGRIACRF